MKKFVFILLALFASLTTKTGFSEETSDHPDFHFAIYVASENLDSHLSSKTAFYTFENMSNLDQFTLNKEPLITNLDIEQYDWSAQEIHLTPEASSRLIQKYGEDLIWDIASIFVIVVDGQRRYAGALMYRESARYVDFPILLAKNENGLCTISVRPNMFFAFGPYPGKPEQMQKYQAQANLIEDMKVKEIFNEKGKLSEKAQEKIK